MLILLILSPLKVVSTLWSLLIIKNDAIKIFTMQLSPFKFYLSKALFKFKYTKNL